MPQTNATLPGMLLLFKDYLPAAVLSGDSFYSALFVAMFIVQVAHASCAAATRKPSSCFLSATAHSTQTFTPQIIRYSTIAGGIFWLVWKTFKQRNAAYKLDPRPLDLAQIRREV